MIRPSIAHVEFLAVRTEDISVTNFLNFRVNPEETEDFDELVDSIQKYGLLQPLLVRENVSEMESEIPQLARRFQLVSGHRRYFACKRLHFATIPCFVMKLDDQEAFEVALVEHVQRQNLNPIEEAEAFKSYVINYGRGSVTRLARKIGKSEEYVSHRLLLLGLPKILEDRISRRLLSPSHATELLWLKNEKQQIELSNEISERNLSLREVRAVVRIVKSTGCVNGAVQQVVQRREDGTARFSPSAENAETMPDPDELPDPWRPYNSRDADPSTDERILDHAVLVVRTCLAGLDLLASQAKASGLPEILIEERGKVHTILDELMRSVRAWRQASV